LVALTLLRLINRTDETIVRQHWRGGGDIVSLVGSIAKIAPMLLPRRVSRVLSSEVELTASGKALENITKKQALFVEVSESASEKTKISSSSWKLFEVKKQKRQAFFNSLTLLLFYGFKQNDYLPTLNVE
jgi:hypothetical protein